MQYAPLRGMLSWAEGQVGTLQHLLPGCRQLATLTAAGHLSAKAGPIPAQIACQRNVHSSQRGTARQIQLRQGQLGCTRASSTATAPLLTPSQPGPTAAAAMSPC